MSAIELKNTVNLSDSGGVYTTIGISDALTLHSMSEILDFVYCSASTDFWQNPKAETTGIYSSVARSPYVFRISGTNVLMEQGDESYDIGLYGKIVWLYGDSLGTFVNPATSNACIITNMDVKKFVMHVKNPNNSSASFREYWGNDWQTRQASRWSDVGKAFDLVCDIYYQDNGVENFNPVNMNSHTRLTNGKIKPYIILPTLNGAYYFASICDEYNHGGSSGYLFNTSGQLFDTLRNSNSSKFSFSPNGVPIPDSVSYYSNGMSYYGVYANELPYSIYFHTGRPYNAYSPISLKCVPNTLDSMNKIKMMSGVWFYTDKLYKPIIVDGYVTGYGGVNDKSDFDNYSYNKGNQHDVPSNPPSGGGGNGDELLDMESRAQFYGSGVTTYYVNVPTAKLKTALGNWDNVATGKDVLKNLISYKLFCFPTSTFTNGMLHDFVIAGTTLKDESDNVIQSAQLTQYGAVSLPSITIPKTFNDFRDYAPYTNLSMYIPLCGWFTLPPWCMGRTISGEMYINGYTGTLKCIVRADGNVVTELGGNAAIDLPFAAEAVGMKSAAVLGNLINTAGSIASIANPSAGGVANVGTAVLGTVCALNANYTESKGTMGDGSNIAGLYHVYIKISRPATIDNEGNSLIAIPTEYKRQYGLPCNKSLTLTKGDGYTQILDANITGNMTAREKQMLIDGFRRGLIL